MLGVTLFGIFLTPVFYYVIQWLNDMVSDARGRSLPPRDHGHGRDDHGDEPEDDPSGEHALSVGHQKGEPSYTHA